MEASNLMKNICITPEAISEMIIEDWINESNDEYTWQFINLEKNNLYYIAVSETLEENLISDQFKNEQLKILKNSGDYNKISYVTLRDFINVENNVVFSKQILKYYQTQGDDLENHIIKLLEKYLPPKLLKYTNIELLYQSDTSLNWNYHDKIDKDLLHVILYNGKTKTTRIIHSIYNCK